MEKRILVFCVYVKVFHLETLLFYSGKYIDCYVFSKSASWGLWANDGGL